MAITASSVLVYSYLLDFWISSPTIFLINYDIIAGSNISLYTTLVRYIAILDTESKHKTLTKSATKLLFVPNSTRQSRN